MLVQRFDFLLFFAFIPLNIQNISVSFWDLGMKVCWSKLLDKDRSLSWMLGHIASFATSFGLLHLPYLGFNSAEYDSVLTALLCKVDAN